MINADEIIATIASEMAKNLHHQAGTSVVMGNAIAKTLTPIVNEIINVIEHQQIQIDELHKMLLAFRPS